MRTLLKFIVTLILITPFFTISHPRNQDDYFNLANNHKHFVSCFFDSKKSSFGKKLAERLLSDVASLDFIKTKNFELAGTDFSDIQMIHNHYDIIGNFAFFYYINNRLQRFDSFSQLAEDFLSQKILYTDLLEKVTTFLKTKVDRINAPISSIEEFNHALANYKIIAVFIGKTQGFFFDQFTEFAEKNVHFNFYYAKDAFIADQIYFQKTQIPRPQNEDLFTIIRDKSLIDELDTKELVAIDAKRLMDDYNLFFDYEQFPKLRDPFHGDDIFFRLYNMNEKLIVYVYNDETSHEQLNQFKKSVYMLPKVFIFSYVNQNHAKWGSYMQMFIQGGQSPTPNRVYIIHARGGNMIVQVIPAEIVAEKIVEGVQRFYNQNRGSFKSVERQLLGGDDITEDAEPVTEENELVYQEL